MAPALLLAVMADKRIRGAAAYRTLLIWPYAVAPAVAAVLWLFIFHPSIGMLGRRLRKLGHALGLQAERRPGDVPGGPRRDAGSR